MQPAGCGRRKRGLKSAQTFSCRRPRGGGGALAERDCRQSRVPREEVSVGRAEPRLAVQVRGMLTAPYMYSAYSTYTIVHTQYRPCPRVQVLRAHRDAPPVLRVGVRPTAVHQEGQLFSPRPIPPSFPALARACLCCLGARMWRVNLLRGVKGMPNPRLTPRLLFPSWHRAP